MDKLSLFLVRSIFMLSFQILFLTGFTQNYVWHKTFNGVDEEIARGIAVDNSGNIYTTGNYTGLPDFDPGVNLLGYPSAGAYDVFITKLTSTGNFSWAKRFGGISDEYATEIETDHIGNVYIIGSFNGSSNLNNNGTANNNTNPYYFTSKGSSDVFIMKLNSSGSILWVRTIGGDGEDGGYHLYVDGAGNVYATGYFYNSSNILYSNSATVSYNPNLPNSSSNDIMLLKININGDFVWAKSISSANSEYGHAITVDGASNLYVTGSFDGTVDFNPGTGINTLVSDGVYDAFLLKLDVNGNYVWAKKFGGTDTEYGQAVTTDLDGNVIIGGRTYGTVDIDPGIAINAQTSELFVVKLSSAGDYKWGNLIDSYDYEAVIPALETDGKGSVYAVAWASAGVNFHDANGSSSQNNYFVNTWQNGVIAKWDKNGTFAWGKYLDGNVYGRDIKIDAAGNVYVNGSYNGSPNFNLNPTLTPYYATGSSNYDSFVAKYSQCGNTHFYNTTYNVCERANIQIGGMTLGATSYSWHPNTYLDNPTSSNPTLTGTTSGTYTMYATELLTGCTTNGSVYVNVLPTPPKGIAGGDIKICESNCTVLVPNLSNPNYYYEWYGDFGTNWGWNYVDIGLCAGTGTYYEYLNVWEASFSCFTTDTVKVEIYPVPYANAGADVSICENNCTSIGSSPVAGWTYSWYPACALSNANSANPTACPTKTTTYTVTVTTPQGCKISDEVTIYVSPAPPANAGIDKTLCAGGNVDIGTLNDVWTYYYQWSNTNTLTNSSSGTTTAYPTTTTNYTLTVTNQITGCQATDVVIVTVASLPTANAGADVSICAGSNINIGTTAVAGHSYSWFPVLGLTTPTAATTSASPSSTTTYTVYVKNIATGCQKADAVVATVKPLPLVTAGKDISLCLGQSTYIGGATLTGTTYSWTFYTGTATNLSSYTVAKPLANPTVTTNYVVTATKSGCVRKDTVKVIVNPNPTANAGTAVAYSGTPVQIGSTPVAGMNYSWSPTTNLTSPVIANPLASPTATTTTYTQKVINASTGCFASANVIVTKGTTAKIKKGKEEVSHLIEKAEEKAENFTILSPAKEEERVTVYPNPTTDKLNLLSEKEMTGEWEISIVNMAGQTLYSEKLSLDYQFLNFVINVSDFSAGVYQVFLKNKEQIINKKFVKE